MSRLIVSLFGVLLIKLGTSAAGAEPLTGPTRDSRSPLHTIAEVNQKQLTNLQLESRLKQLYGVHYWSFSTSLQKGLRRLALERIVEEELLIPTEALQVLSAQAANHPIVSTEVSAESVVKVPEEIFARHILIPVRPDATSAEELAAKNTAEAILYDAQGGTIPFSELAKQFSGASDAKRGGVIPYFTRNQFESSFSDLAFSLQPGEIGGPVRTRYGFHLIRVEARRGGEEAPRNHERLSRDQELESLREKLGQLKRNAKVIVYIN